MTEAQTISSGTARPQAQLGADKLFWIFTALYFATRLPWIFMVPMVEAPDEFAHFWVLRFLVEHLRLPMAQEVLAGGPSAVYGSLPPFGYVPHAAAGLVGQVIAPGVDLSLASRFGSLISGYVMLWCADQIGRKLFKADRLLYLALPLIIIFHPQMVLVDSYANSDSVTTALSSLALLLICQMLENGLQTKSSLALGFTLGWLALTKYTGLAAFPACALGYVCAAWLNCQSRAKFFGQALLALVVTCATCIWWFLRNGSIFGGDYLGTQTMFHTWAVTYKKSLHPDISAWAVLKQKQWWRFTVFSYWGMFGYMTRYLWRPIYWVYIVLTLIALGGGIKAGVMKIGQKKATAGDNASLKSLSADERKARFTQSAIWLVLATCVLTNITMMVYSSMKNLGGGQGRYLFPSEIPIIALIIGGLNLTSKKSGKPLVVLLVIFNIIVYVAAFCMLCPEYGFRFSKTY